MAPVKATFGDPEDGECEGGDASTGKGQNEQNGAADRSEACEQGGQALRGGTGKAPRHGDAGDRAECQPGKNDGERRDVAPPKPDQDRDQGCAEDEAEEPSIASFEVGDTKAMSKLPGSATDPADQGELRTALEPSEGAADQHRHHGKGDRAERTDQPGRLIRIGEQPDITQTPGTPKSPAEEVDDPARDQRKAETGPQRSNRPGWPEPPIEPAQIAGNERITRRRLIGHLHGGCGLWRRGRCRIGDHGSPPLGILRAR